MKVPGRIGPLSDGIEAGAGELVEAAFFVFEFAGIAGAGFVEFQDHGGVRFVNRIPILDVEYARFGDPVVPFPSVMKFPVRLEAQAVRGFPFLRGIKRIDVGPFVALQESLERSESCGG